jgi:O-antigen ligase
MLSKIIKNTSNYIVTYGVPFLYLALAVSFCLYTYDSAQIKITVLHLGGVIVIAAWLINKLEEGTLNTIKKDFIIYLPAFLFLLSAVLSFTFSPFKAASAMELIKRCIYVGLFTVIVSHFNDERKINRIINYLILAAYIACAYGLLQFIGLDGFHWKGAYGKRIFSTFGNPNFFGDFLIVMAPVIFGVFLKRKSFHLLFLLALTIFCTVLTYSKGAWLGLAAGAVAFAFLYVYFFSKSIKKMLISLAVISAVIITITAGAIVYQSGKRSDSLSFRIFTWLSTVEMIKANPVFGSGIGTFYINYPKYRRPQIFFIENIHNNQTDHPENEFLEIWYDEGALGLAIFLLLALTVSMLGFKTLQYQKRENKKNYYTFLIIGLLSAFIAQLAHDMVCVSLRFVSSGAVLWLVMGLICAIYINVSGRANLKPSVLNMPAKRIAQLIVLLLAIFLCYKFYGFFQADMLHLKGIVYSKEGKHLKAFECFEYVSDKNPAFPMPDYFTANVNFERWAYKDSERAIKALEKLWQKAPNYVQSKYIAGLVYTRIWMDLAAKPPQDAGKLDAYNKELNNAFNNAVKYFKQALSLDPIFAQTYHQLAALYAAVNDFDTAEKIYLAHLNFPQTLSQPPHNIWVENWQSRRAQDYAHTQALLAKLKKVKS